MMILNFNFFLHYFTIDTMDKNPKNLNVNTKCQSPMRLRSRAIQKYLWTRGFDA